MTDPLVRFKRRPTPDSFERLVRETSGDVLAAAHRVLGDRSMAEDVAQEVFMKALDDQWPGQRIRSGIGLLVSTAIYRAKTLLRTDVRRRAREEAAASPARAVSAAPPLAPEERWALHDALADLEQPWRETIELHYFGGLEVNAIADVTGTSVRTVRDRLARGRRRLSEKLRHVGAIGLATGFEATPIVRPATVEVRDVWVERVCRSGARALGAAATSVGLATTLLTWLRAAGVLVLLGVVGGGGYWIFTSSRDASNDSIARVENHASAAADATSHEPGDVDATRERAGRADSSERPEPTDTAEAGPTALEIEVLRQGEWAREGTLVLGATPGSVEELTRRVAEHPEIASRYEWLMSPISLARTDSNPIVIEDVPEVFCSIEYSARVLVDGDLLAEARFEIRPGERNRLALELSDTPLGGSVVSDTTDLERLAEEIGPGGLFIEVIDEDGALVRDGTLLLDGGLGLLSIASDPAVGIKLSPFAWLNEPIDLASRNPIEVRDFPEELHGIPFRVQVASSAGYAKPARLKLSGDSGTVHRVVLRRLSTREVRVVDAVTDQPLANAHIVNMSYSEDFWGMSEALSALGGGRVATDRDGRARVEVVTTQHGDQDIYVYAAGYSVRRERMQLEADDATVIELAPLAESGTVVVDVIAADGSGAPDVPVLFYPSSGTLGRQVVTDDRGRAVFPNSEVGTAIVRIDLPEGQLGPGSCTERAEVDVRPDQEVSARLGIVGSGRLVVRVVDESGKPQRWVRVGLFGPSTGDARTGWSGNAEFTHLEAGHYRLIVDRAPRRSPISYEFDLVAGEERELRFVRGSASVSGKFIGEKLLFAEVELIADDGSTQSDTAGEDGAFLIRHVAAGRYLLVGSHAGSAPVRRVIEVHEGVDIESVELALGPGSALAITFEPRIEAFDVEIRVFDSVGRPVEPDSKGGGWWRSPSLGAESYRIELVRGDAPPAVTTVKLEPERETKLIFDAQDLTLQSTETK